LEERGEEGREKRDEWRRHRSNERVGAAAYPYARQGQFALLNGTQRSAVIRNSTGTALW